MLPTAICTFDLQAARQSPDIKAPLLILQGMDDLDKAQVRPSLAPEWTVHSCQPAGSSMRRCWVLASLGLSACLSSAWLPASQPLATLLSSQALLRQAIGFWPGISCLTAWLQGTPQIGRWTGDDDDIVAEIAIGAQPSPQSHPIAA